MRMNLMKERAEDQYWSQYCQRLEYQPLWTHHGLWCEVSLESIRSALEKNCDKMCSKKQWRITWPSFHAKVNSALLHHSYRYDPKWFNMPFLIYICVKQNRLWLLGKHLILLCLWFWKVFFLHPFWEEETILCGFFCPCLLLICELSLQISLSHLKTK